MVGINCVGKVNNGDPSVAVREGVLDAEASMASHRHLAAIERLAQTRGHYHPGTECDRHAHPSVESEGEKRKFEDPGGKIQRCSMKRMFNEKDAQGQG